MSLDKQYNIAVLGGGSFGTAIADICAHNGHQVNIWVRDPEQVDSINEQHINTKYLSQFRIHKSIKASLNIDLITQQADVIFVAIPSISFRSVVQSFDTVKGQVLVSTTKGIEEKSFALMSEVLAMEHPEARVGALSGPNLAKEIMSKALTGTVIASQDDDLCQLIQRLLHSSYFRVYTNHDTYGVELAGALKNIYAIIVGMASALGLGENTKSMLITRGLAEMSRFAVCMGANPLTFLGLAGVGDLIVTCASSLSRNHQVGYFLAKGFNLDQAVAKIGQTAEGIRTLKMVHEKARELKVYMPLLTGLYGVVYEQKTVDELARRMMLQEQKSDVEFSVRN